MVSNAGRYVQEFEEDWMFVERFIHDVLVYTLTKCGLPESSLPTTDCAENIYPHTDFLKIAGASVLRISLVMRDKWKQMFKSRRNSSGFNDKNILKFMIDVAICYRTSRTCPEQSLVELFLALCNEIMLYFHFENIDIDFKNLFKMSVCFAHTTEIIRNDPEKLEELFDSFDDISGYTEWINDFISRFAIPYGSRDDVSDLFFERVSNKFENDFKKLTESFRFLPYDLFSAITAGRSKDFDKLTSIQSDGQSPEPPNFPMGSEIGALGELKFLGSSSTRTENISEHLSQNQSSKLEQRVTDGGSKSLDKFISITNDIQSLECHKLLTDSGMGAEGIKKSFGSLSTCTENVSEHLAENNQSSDISSEVAIGQDSGKAGLVADKTSPEIHGAKAKRKIVEKEKDIGKRKLILVLSSFIAYAFLVMCFKIYTSK